jgi:Isocitrate/isopropylmalate dehydrogenase
LLFFGGLLFFVGVVPNRIVEWLDCWTKIQYLGVRLSLLFPNAHMGNGCCICTTEFQPYVPTKPSSTDRRQQVLDTKRFMMLLAARFLLCAFACWAVRSVSSFTASSVVASRRAAVASRGAPPLGDTATTTKQKKDSYIITVLPGDGIGPEITAATKVVLSALTERCGFTLQLREALIGGAAIDQVGDPFPAATLVQCQASDSVLLACIGGYKWDQNPRELRPESGLLKMRKQLGLFANLRPAKVLPQLIDASTLKREVVEGVDVMVVRELTGDVYFGTPKGIDIIDGE